MANRTGVGRHTREILFHMLDIESDFDYDLIAHDLLYDTPNSHYIFDNSNRFGFLEHKITSERLFSNNYTLFHSFDYSVPPIQNAILIATIHDLTRLNNLSYYYSNSDFINRYGIQKFLNLLRLKTLSIRYTIDIRNILDQMRVDDSEIPMRKLHFWYHMIMLLRIKYFASHIVTVSEYSKQNICNLLCIPPSKVTTIYNGVRPFFKTFLQKRPEIPPIIYSQIGTNPYFVYVGLWRQHKNIPTLLYAFANLLNIEGCENIFLIMVGQKDNNESHVYEAIDSLGIHERVIFTGQLTDHDLAWVYSGAIASVLPSLDEGFGLTALESQASGTPTIVSDIPVLREIIGNTGLFFNPNKPDELTKLMYLLMNSTDLQLSLAEKGIQNADRFHWRKSAEELVNLHSKIIIEKVDQ